MLKKQTGRTEALDIASVLIQYFDISKHLSAVVKLLVIFKLLHPNEAVFAMKGVEYVVQMIRRVS